MNLDLKRKHSVRVIEYPFSGAAEIISFRSKWMPSIIRAVSSRFVKKIVRDWRTAAVPNTVSGKVTNGVRNWYEVKEAVTALATETARSQWAGVRTLALGGDHSQGFATVKATMLVEVTRAILHAESIPVDAATKRTLWSLTDEGKWTDVADIVDRLAKSDEIVRNGIQKVIKGLAILWVDTHGDFNNRFTSGSQNFHGMALAAACGEDTGGIEKVFGECIKADPPNVWVVCCRHLDKKEEKLMSDRGVNFREFDMSHPEKPQIRAYCTQDGRYVGQPKGKSPRVAMELRSAVQLAHDLPLGKSGRVSKDIPLYEIIQSIIWGNPDKKFIVSVDVDHLSGSYVSVTGTPMGLTREDVRGYRPHSPGATRVEVPRNRFGVSARGPSIQDSIAALYGVATCYEQVLATDLTEGNYAIGKYGKPKNDNTMTPYATHQLFTTMMGIPFHTALWATLSIKKTEADLRNSIGALLKQELSSAPTSPSQHGGQSQSHIRSNRDARLG